VLLGLLGHAYDLEKRHAYGLSAYVRAIALHPRYPVARYRAAISCSLLAARDACQWSSASEALRSELKDGLSAAADVLGLSWSKESKIGNDQLWHLTGRAAVTPLACAGDDLLKNNGVALTKASLVHHAFRRSERRYWLTLLLRLRSRAIQTGIRRDALYAVNESARPAVLSRAASGCEVSAEAEAPEKETVEKARDDLEKKARDAARKVLNARDLTWQVDYNLACAEAIARSHDGWRDAAFDYLQGLVRRPHLEQLTRSWVETDPDLEPLRSDGGVARIQLVLRNLRSEPAAEWTALVKRHAEDTRRHLGLHDLVDVDHARTGAQAVFTGDPPQAVDLHDQSRAGDISLRAWQRIPPGRRRQLPLELRELVDELAEAEWRLAVEALGDGDVIAIDSSDPQDALARARRVLLPARDLIAIAPAGSTPAAAATLRDVRVLGGRSSLGAPMLVAIDQRPLTEILGQPLRFHHVVGKDKVGFVLHQRVGFVRRPGSTVVVLQGLANIPAPDLQPSGIRASIT
jgi:hypothetical protein